MGAKKLGSWELKVEKLRLGKLRLGMQLGIRRRENKHDEYNNPTMIEIVLVGDGRIAHGLARLLQPKALCELVEIRAVCRVIEMVGDRAAV